MVCQRCVMAVEQVLKELNIDFHAVSIGEAELCHPLSAAQHQQLQEKLGSIGFELIDNRKTEMIEKIKKLIILKARNEVSEKEQHLNFSDYLLQHLHYDYTYLSNLFSSIEGVTIEKFFIAQRIEKAKELLVYDQLSLSEIAWQLDYSSVAHLSNQFKKITGLTPSHFKKIGREKRKFLDQV